MGRFIAFVAMLATFSAVTSTPLLRHGKYVPGTTNTERMLQETGDDKAEPTMQRVGVATSIKKKAPDEDLIPNTGCSAWMCSEDYVLIDNAISVECPEFTGCYAEMCCVHESNIHVETRHRRRRTGRTPQNGTIIHCKGCLSAKEQKP